MIVRRVSGADGGLHTDPQAARQAEGLRDTESDWTACCGRMKIMLCFGDELWGGDEVQCVNPVGEKTWAPLARRPEGDR